MARNWYIPWFGMVFSAAVLLLLGLLGTFIYFSATGGNDYITHEKVGGVECIVTRSRWDNNVNQVSCPPVQR